MKITRYWILTATVAALTSASWGQESTVTLHAEMTGIPSNLAKLRDYRTARVSSEDREGNADMRRIAPGETLELANLEGAGEITHIWTTVSTPDQNHLKNLVFRIFWDGKEYPSVESPLGDFFGLGLGKYYIFDNPVQAIGSDRGMNCFWPMPYRDGARLTVTNESETTVGAYYYYIDYRKYDKLPEDVGYFHAQYRQEKPTREGQNYLILDTDGGRGHFAGVNMSIHTQSSGWWGEGDDIFTIDGEDTPSIWGTGSEDYFCGAWCYGETFYNNYFGMPLRERIDHGPDNYWNVYRLHLESPVTFRESLKVEIEHGHDGVSNTRTPRNNDHSSVAYWYVDNPRPLKGKLADKADRLPSFKPMPTPENGFELQYMKQEKTVGDTESQLMMRTPDRDGDWFNGDQLFVRGAETGETTKLTFETTDTLSGPAFLFVTRARDYGQVEVKLDGKVIAKYDGYAPSIDRRRVSLGNLELEPGIHTMEITITGKADESSANFWGIDYIKIGGGPDPEEDAVEELKQM